MECQKVTNLLDTTSDTEPRLITKKWIEVYDLSCNAENRYKPSKQIRFKTTMLQSDLCNYSGAYIVVKETNVTDPKSNAYYKKLVSKKRCTIH